MPLSPKINYQLPLLLPFPSVYGPKDYREFRDTLYEMNNLLEQTNVEFVFIEKDLEKCGIITPTNLDIEYRRRMIRCSILKVLSGLDYRELSVRLADSELYQWFTRYNIVGDRRPPSKSTLERFCKHFDYDDICSAIDLVTKSVSGDENAQTLLNREEGINIDHIFADGTCIESPIHFPVDWVLLRDSVRTLSKSIICIRNQGLKHRMPTPESFISKINTLCIEMSNSRRKTAAKKKRKVILRKMKQLTKTI